MNNSENLPLSNEVPEKDQNLGTPTKNTEDDIVDGNLDGPVNGEEPDQPVEAVNPPADCTSEEKETLQDEKFHLVEAEVLKTLNELGDDETMAKFRLEYEKLFKTLVKSRENEKRLLTKCKDLNGEMNTNAVKVQAAVKMSQADRATIANLKKEIKKAWQMVEQMNERETRSKETIQQLKTEISSAQKLLEQGGSLSIGQENSVNELIRVCSLLSETNQS